MQCDHQMRSVADHTFWISPRPDKMHRSFKVQKTVMIDKSHAHHQEAHSHQLAKLYFASSRLGRTWCLPSNRLQCVPTHSWAEHGVCGPADWRVNQLSAVQNMALPFDRLEYEPTFGWAECGICHSTDWSVNQLLAGQNMVFAI